MWIRIMARNDHQRASVSTPINNFLYFFAYFICGMDLPALWMNCHWGNIGFARITQPSTDFWCILYFLCCKLSEKRSFLICNCLGFCPGVFSCKHIFQLISRRISQRSELPTRMESLSESVGSAEFEDEIWDCSPPSLPRRIFTLPIWLWKPWNHFLYIKLNSCWTTPGFGYIAEMTICPKN